jgi:hypothetical protein
MMCPSHMIYWTWDITSQNGTRDSMEYASIYIHIDRQWFGWWCHIYIYPFNDIHNTYIHTYVRTYVHTYIHTYCTFFASKIGWWFPIDDHISMMGWNRQLTHISRGFDMFTQQSLCGCHSCWSFLVQNHSIFGVLCHLCWFSIYQFFLILLATFASDFPAVWRL